jgi:hypothetical protein
LAAKLKANKGRRQKDAEWDSGSKAIHVPRSDAPIASRAVLSYVFDEAERKIWIERQKG